MESSVPTKPKRHFAGRYNSVFFVLVLGHVASASPGAGALAAPTTRSRSRRSLAAPLQGEWISRESRTRAPCAFAGEVSIGPGCVVRAPEMTARWNSLREEIGG